MCIRDRYKANRHGMPEELRMQLPLIQEILAALGYAVVGCEGFEGDDILGTLSSACEQNGEDCVVVSGDRDCLQLVTDKVSVELVRTKDNTLYTPEIFFAEYGFSPEHMIDLKGLMGDSSDNIPGVKGIGEKTAKALLLQYGSIEALYALQMCIRDSFQLRTVGFWQNLRRNSQRIKGRAFSSMKGADSPVNFF